MIRLKSVTIVLLGLATALILTGCVDKSRDLPSTGSNAQPNAGADTNTVSDDTTDFDRGALMSNLVDNIFIPNYQVTANLSANFSDASGSLANYCNAVGDADEIAQLETAKSAWRALMDAVQKTEMHVLGPAQLNDEAWQKRIHSYTNGNLATCALDQSVIQLQNDASFQVVNRALNQRGMGAIEYLLYNDNLNHSCSSQVSTTDGWNDLPESTRKIQRCNLALKLAEDVAEASQLIYDQWTSGDTPYRTEFLAEASRGENFQQITDAMFYIETYTKSSKLATPLGLNDKCSAITCPNLVESPYSKTSLQNIKVNSQEFLSIFNGADGLGFDDLISDADFAHISARFQNQLASVIDTVDTISTPLGNQVASINSEADETQCTNAFANPDYESTHQACSLAGLLKKVTDDLKIEFVTIVDVPLPGRVQSDND